MSVKKLLTGPALRVQCGGNGAQHEPAASPSRSINVPWSSLALRLSNWDAARQTLPPKQRQGCGVPWGWARLTKYCAPNNRAIALPLRRLQPLTLAGFVGMLREPPDRTWELIEIDVKRNAASCFIGAPGSRRIEWGAAPLGNYSSVPSLAFAYVKPDFKQGWARKIHADGALLFRELVISALGPGLFSHLERAAGGLENLAFRFCVDDPLLHTAPFEATVRLSGQPFSGTEDDFNQSPFVLVNVGRPKSTAASSAAMSNRQISARTGEIADSGRSRWPSADPGRAGLREGAVKPRR
jgi:hypothetical protein